MLNLFIAFIKCSCMTQVTIIEKMNQTIYECLFWLIFFIFKSKYGFIFSIIKVRWWILSPRWEKQVLKNYSKFNIIGFIVIFSTIVSNKLKHQTKSSTPKSISLHCNMTTSKHTDKCCVQHNMVTKYFFFWQ